VRDLSELYLRRSGPPASTEAVRAFEEHFHVTLPADYLHFLSLANGGEPMLDCTFDYTTAFGEFVKDADQAAEFFSLTAAPEDLGGVWENTQHLLKALRSVGNNIKVVCIGRNSEADAIYLDMDTDPPRICILYLDYKETIPKIADSFDEFVASLHYRR